MQFLSNFCAIWTIPCFQFWVRPLLVLLSPSVISTTVYNTGTMHNSKDVEEANIEMQNCEAYETINAVKQRRAVVHGQSNTQSQW